MAEEIRFPIVGEDRGATRVLKDVGHESAVAAAQTRLLAESLDKQKRAADASVRATIAAANADKILAEASDDAIASHVKQRIESENLKKSQDSLGKSTYGLKARFQELAGGVGAAGTGLGGSGMAAAIGAGVALSGQIATLGLGFGGLALAAAGLVKPIEKAAQASGGLAANMHKLDPEQQKVALGLLGLGRQYHAFQNALKPQVLTAVNDGFRIAGHLLADVEPIAKQTGIALDQVLGTIDREFQSGEWKQFFSYMAQQAAPDVRQLGMVFTDLMKTLPPLLKELHPVGQDLLDITDAAAKLINEGANLQASVDKTTKHEGFMAQVTDHLRMLLFSPGYGLHYALKLVGAASSDTAVAAARQASAMAALDERVTHTRAATADLIHPLDAAASGLQSTADAAAAAEAKAAAAGAAVDTLAGSIHHLNSELAKSITPNATFNQGLIDEANAAKQAHDALKASNGVIGRNTQAQRDAASSTQGWVNQLITLTTEAGKNRQKQQQATQAIRDALPQLENVKGGTREYWQEIRTLIRYMQGVKRELDVLRQEKALDEKIRITGEGGWTVQGGIPVHKGALQRAAGGMITGGVPGRDSVPIMAMPGEVVVPTKMVAAGAVDHLRGKLPGFAAGGIIPSYEGSVRGLPGWTEHNWNATVRSITTSIAGALARSFQAAMATGAIGDTGARSANAAVAQAFARSILPAGWSWPALLSLWNQESGWNAYAVNKSSGAYGIPQSLGHGHVFNLGDYKAQIIWGINYIRSAYGSSQAAWAHEQSHNWYAGGTGAAAPGWAWVGERGPELVRMVGGETVLPHRLSVAVGGGVTRGHASGILGELRHLSPSTTHLWEDIHRMLRQIHNRYTGATRRRLDRLVEQQARDIAAARRDIKDMKERAQASRQYAASVRQGLSGFADLSGMTLGAGFAGGRQLTGPQVLQRQLSGSLGELRHFARVLKRLDHLHLPGSLLRQVVAMGPGPGTQWGEELLSAGPGLLRKISAAERDINAEERRIGQIAAHDIYGDTSRRALRRQFSRERGTLVNIEQLIVGHPADIDKIAQRLSHRITAHGLGS